MDTRGCHDTNGIYDSYFHRLLPSFSPLALATPDERSPHHGLPLWRNITVWQLSFPDTTHLPKVVTTGRASKAKRSYWKGREAASETEKPMASVERAALTPSATERLCGEFSEIQSGKGYNHSLLQAKNSRLVTGLKDSDC